MNPSPGDLNAFTIAAYMRVTSLAIAAYDYLETQPTAWRFYREHWESKRLTISVLLFSLLRSLSIVTLTISNIGFFYSHFTQATCSRFYLFPPAFKVVQAMVTQAILGVRAFNLSRRDRVVGKILLALYCVACILQWVVTLYQRTPLVGDVRANCRAVNQVKVLGAYLFYAIAMIYDTITTSVSVLYLVKFKLSTTNSVMVKLTRMMLYDGLGYLIVLTGINVFNLILFKTSQDIQASILENLPCMDVDLFHYSEQTAASSLAYSVSWIMSQRLLIHLYDASREHREDDLSGAEITITKNIGTAREISRVIRTQFDRKSETPFELARRPPLESASEEGEYRDNIDVRVRIEKTVKLNQYTRNYELEDYTRSRRSQML